MPDLVHVKLPDNCVVNVGEIPLKLIMGIAAVDPGIIPALEQAAGASFPVVLVNHHEHCGPPEACGAPPGFPMPSPTTRFIGVATNLVSMFIQLRYNVAARQQARREDDDDDLRDTGGDAWKQRDQEEEIEVATLTSGEQLLYDTCLRELTRYVRNAGAQESVKL